VEKYPKGFSDYLPDLVRYDKPDGSSFYAVTIEIPDAVYLVKIKIKTDDVDDLERWLEGEEAENEGSNGAAEGSAAAGGDMPGEDVPDYRNDKEPSSEEDL
jgi:hypothetical protein